MNSHRIDVNPYAAPATSDFLPTESLEQACRYLRGMGWGTITYVVFGFSFGIFTAFFNPQVPLIHTGLVCLLLTLVLQTGVLLLRVVRALPLRFNKTYKRAMACYSCWSSLFSGTHTSGIHSHISARNISWICRNRFRSQDSARLNVYVC